jgi:acyl dehydratase
MLYFEDIELNKSHCSREFKVDKQALIDFAREWDPQPFHTDEVAAKQHPTGLIGSSVHSYAIMTKLLTELDVEPPAIVAGLGIDQWRMPAPLRPGDTVRALSYVESKRESSSKPNMGILVSVSSLLNQRDEVILTYKSSGLILKKPVQ